MINKQSFFSELELETFRDCLLPNIFIEVYLCVEILELRIQTRHISSHRLFLTDGVVSDIHPYNHHTGLSPSRKWVHEVSEFPRSPSDLPYDLHYDVDDDFGFGVWVGDTLME